MPGPDAGRRWAAFTLLEVMCAVVVLGIVLTALARASTMGLRNEGETTRRAHASLLADREIEGIEANLALGQAPRPGTQSDDQGIFRVKIEVKPFDAQAEGLHAAPALPGDQPNRNLPPGPPKGLLALSRTGADPLLWATVRVDWNEGVDAREVTRTTLLFDPAAAAPLLATLSAPGQAGGPGQGGAQGAGSAQGQTTDQPAPAPVRSAP